MRRLAPARSRSLEAAAIFGAVALCGLVSCVSLEARTAKLTSCEETEVLISDKRGGLTQKTWLATCGERQFMCTYSPRMTTGVGGVSATTAEQEACIESTPGG